MSNIFNRQQVDDITAPWLSLCKEQEERIVELEAENKALRDPFRWRVTADDPLPKVGDEVWVSANDVLDPWHTQWDQDMSDWVLYWMPVFVPEPPKEGK